MFNRLGFAAKSNIKSLFQNQKKAMRAIKLGFVNYFYNNGQLPALTESGFYECGILTIYDITAKNALLFMPKVNHFPSSLSQSIRETRYQTMPQQLVQIMITDQHCYKNMARPVLLHKFLAKVLYLQLRPPI